MTRSAAFRIPARHRASGLLASQHGANARQKFAKAERFGDIVVGAQLQPDDPIDLVAPVTGGNDYRNIGARSDLAQQVETVLLAEPQIEDHEIRLARREVMGHLLPPRRANGVHIVLLEVVGDHAQHDRIVLDDEDARRPIVGGAQAQI